MSKRQKKIPVIIAVGVALVLLTTVVAIRYQHNKAISNLVDSIEININQQTLLSLEFADSDVLELLELDPSNIQIEEFRKEIEEGRIKFYEERQAFRAKHGIAMVEIPAGSFESGRVRDEIQHKVTISKPFLMIKTEVTRKLWQAVMGNSPGRFDGDNNPVEGVTWYECLEFCNNLSKKEGLEPVYKFKIGSTNVTWNKNKNGYRLPTAAEWEYACYAGTTTRINSDSDLKKVGWLSENSRRKTHPVAQKTPNSWGLYDMHGNVYEWCWDRESAWGILDWRVVFGGCYTTNAWEYLYPEETSYNPDYYAPATNICEYLYPEETLYNPDNAYATCGFRFVRSVQ
jgi:formylglycine-generating enzyme